MLKSIKSFSKRTVSIILSVMMIVSMMLVGMVTTAAIDIGGYIYFVKPDEWTDNIQFFVGKSGYSNGYQMSKVSNTDNLYYVQTSNWDDATEFSFFNTSGWGGENNSISHRANYAITTEVKSGYDLTTGETYIITPSSSSDGASISINAFGSSKKGYSYLNSSQTIKVTTSSDGTTYSTPSTSPATLKLTGYAFGAYNTCNTSKTATVSGTTTSASASVGYLANTNVTATVTDSSYAFVGWYNGTSLVSTNTTYSYNPTSTKTLTARFKLNGKSITCEKPENGTLDADKDYAAKDAEVTFTAVANPGYELDTLTINGTEITSGITTNGNTSTYSYTMPSTDVTAEATFKKSNYTVNFDNDAITGGSISVDKSTAQMDDIVTITAVPDEANDYYLSGISVVDANNSAVSVIGTGNTRTFTMPASNVTITPTFSKNTYDISASFNSDGGTVKTYVNGNEADAFSIGDTIKITAESKEGYSLTSITVGSEAVELTDGEYSFTATSKNAISVSAEFVAKTYDVNYGTVTGATAPASPVTNAQYNSTVTISPYEATTGYKITGYTVKTTSGTAVDLTSSNGIYTFKMPASNVTITPNVVSSAIVTVTSNDTTLGTATATPSTGVYVGDTITLTAAATNGSFTNWTITGATYNSGYTSSNAEVKVTVTGNVSATANFEEKTYEVSIFSQTYSTAVNSTIAMKATDVAGVFISTATVSDNTVFTVKKLSDNTYAKSNANDAGYWIEKTNKPVTVTGWESSKSSTNYVYRAKTGSSVYVVFDANTNEIYLSTDPNNKKVFDVYAKTGTNRDTTNLNLGGDMTYKYATKTIISRINDETNIDEPTQTFKRTSEYSIAEDSVITIETYMEDSYHDLTYYIEAYCINGKYVKAEKKNNEGVYFANYTLTAAEAVSNAFEITPVYYNKKIADESNYITFYVDAEDVPEHWGKTVSVNADYEGASNSHYTGGYPGQPMMLRGKYYEIKIPKYYYSMSSGTPLVDKTHPVTSVTMNSYHWDSVHYYIDKGYGYNVDSHDSNYQTYDFADFAWLAKKDNVQTILFENKFYPQDASTNNAYYWDWTQITNIANADAFSSNAVNEWQDFTDYYGTETDIYGNILTDEQKAKTQKLYIISMGNWDTDSSHNTNATWATRWNVYDQTGKRIAVGTPADFLDSTKQCYKDVENYKNCQVFISYDKERGSTDSGKRSDGRWYYSQVGLEFTSNVIIEYFDENNVLYSDVNTNTENTGFIGENTNGTKATLDGYTSEKFDTVDKKVVLDCKLGDRWQFVGWYIKTTNKDGTVTYTELSNNATYNDFIMNNAFTIVARVKQIPVGSLVLTHSQYTGSDPAYHDGTGDYYISATVKHGNNIISQVTESKTAISIPELSADYTIEITLRTKCHGDNTFYAWYEIDNGRYFEIAGETEDPRGEKDVSYTFTVEADKLFDVSGKLATSSLDFYSDIIKVSAHCTIEYRYYDRFEVNGNGTMVSYIVRDVELTTDEIENNYILQREDVLSKLAPEIDTMYVDTVWQITDVTNQIDPNYVDRKTCYVVVTAVQTDKICKVIAPNNLTEIDNPENIMYDAKAYDVVFNSWFVDDEGNFKLTAPKTIGDYSFTRWEVYKLDEQGEDTGELVTVLSDRIFTLRIMADYKLVPVYNNTPDKITAHISAPVLNREIYGDSTNPTDKLYVDFLVAFTSTDIPVFKENTTDYTVECGVIVDRNNTLKLSAEDRAAIIAAAEAGNANPLNIATYKAQFGTNYDEITRVAFDDQYVDKAKVTYTDTNNNVHRLSKYVLDNDQLTNKNRIDKVLTYTNNEDNQNYIFAAYSYVIIRDASGETVASAITTTDDAQFYNLCYKGNEPYEKTTS